MRGLGEQTHYEVLEVPRNSETPEIERAYRLLQSIYSSDSLALYSVFDEADGAVLKQRIELAYRVLADADTRRAYDEEVDSWGAEQESPPAERATADATASFPASLLPGDGDGASFQDSFEDDLGGELNGQAVEPGGVELGSGIERFLDLEGDAEEGEGFDGHRLRRARLDRGIEIDQIADVTKVSRAFLRSIEDEAYDDLPAPVYVRGFVVAYARAIGLDPEKVAPSYMARLDDSKGSRRKGRLLGRR